MATNTTLYLTQAESAVFSALPDALREGWTVEEEKGTAYEDAEVLGVRAGMARFDTYPALKGLAQQVAAGTPLTPAQIDAIPESVLPELYFTMGARGVGRLIAMLMRNAKTDQDVSGIAGLTHIRHDILVTNASISYL